MTLELNYPMIFMEFNEETTWISAKYKNTVSDERCSYTKGMIRRMGWKADFIRNTDMRSK